MLRAASTASPVRGFDVGGRLHWTSSLTGVTSQLFGIDQLEDADHRYASCRSRLLVSTFDRTCLLHLVVQCRAGVLVLDLVGELAECDRARGIAKVGAVDRRPCLYTHDDIARQSVDLDLVVVGLSRAEHAGQRNRYDRTCARGYAVFVTCRLLVSRDRVGEIDSIDCTLLDIRHHLREFLGAVGLR